MKKTPRAFTLIEVSTASAIFAIGLAAVLTSVSTMGGLFAHYELETSALSVADGFIEDLLLAPRGSVDLVPGTYTRTVDELGATASGPFTLTWVVEGGQPISGMRRITVDVAWTERLTVRRVVLKTARE